MCESPLHLNDIVRLRVFLLIESGQAPGDHAKLLLEAVDLEQAFVQFLQSLTIASMQTGGGFIK